MLVKSMPLESGDSPSLLGLLWQIAQTLLTHGIYLPWYKKLWVVLQSGHERHASLLQVVNE